MSWLAQAWHVLKKDCRQFRMMWAIYLVLGFLACLHAGGVTGTNSGVFELVGIVFVAVGMLLTAMHVQTDSPLPGRAFWASRPLQPTAVLGAKVGGMLVVLLSGAAFQAAGLLVNHVSARDIPYSLAGSVGSYATCLASAFAVAVITPSIPSLIATSVVISIGSAVAFMGILAKFGGAMPSGTVSRSALYLLAYAAGIGLAALLYSIRGGDRRARLLVIVPALILTTAMGVQDSPRYPALVSDVPVTAAIADTMSLHGGAVASVSLRPRSAASGVRVALVSPALWIALEGRSRRYSLGHSGPVTIIGEDSLFVGYRRMAGPGARGDTNVVMQAATGMAAPLPGRPVSAEISALMIVQRHTLTDRLPLETSRSVAIDNGRMTIDSLLVDEREFSLSVRKQTAESGDRSARLGYLAPESLDAWLVNDARREAVRLERVSTSARTSWMILPGSTLATVDWNYRLPELARIPRPETPGPDYINVDAAWLSGAHLVLQGWSAEEERTARIPVRLGP